MTTDAPNLPDRVADALLIARLAVFEMAFTAGEAARMTNADCSALAKTLHRLTRRGLVERTHRGEAVTCRYRLTDAGEKLASRVGIKCEPKPTDAERGFTALAPNACVSEKTLRLQCQLSASVIDRELGRLVSSGAVTKRVTDQAFWYRRNTARD